MMNDMTAGFNRLKRETEDIMLSVMVWLAKVTRSKSMDKCISEHADRRIAKIRKEIIKLNWKKAKLEKRS